MKSGAQIIVFALAVILLFLLTSPRGNQSNVLINQDIARSSLANLSEISLPDQPPLKVKTYSALAQEVGGSQVFYELNSDRRWPLASLTKLMTALVALEQIPASQERDDFIKQMLIASANAAAERLAAVIGEERFVALMNQRASELQMVQSSFFDTSGLSFLNQSTVADLYKLVNYIAQRQPEIFQWSRQPSIVIDGAVHQNINRFASRPDYLGGKTGWTEDANGNLISLFSGNSRPLAIIILGAPDRIERFAQTEALRKWIFQSFKP